MIHDVAITPFDAAAILIVLAAVLGYINHRLLKLPPSIGLTVMGAVASLIVIGIDRCCRRAAWASRSSASSPGSISMRR
jgi:CPA1 family monovalent cation:H+ antiporter